MKSKTIIKILIVCIIILVIGLIGTAIIYFTTDKLKPASNLFNKYLKQGIIAFDSISDLAEEDKYINTLKDKNYNDNTNIKMSYNNNQGNDEIYNGSISGMTSNTNKNSYRTCNVKFGENDILNFEFLKEDNTYGILFSDVVKKFISIDFNNKDVILQNLNIDKNLFDNYYFINLLGNIEKNKDIVLNILYRDIQSINEKQFSKEKEKNITLSNAQTITTNEYKMIISKDQTKKIYMDILKQLEDKNLIDKLYNPDQEFSELYVSSFVNNKMIKRIEIEYEDKRIQIDFLENEINIKIIMTNEGNIKTTNIRINKQNEGKTIELEEPNNNVKIQYKIENKENKTNLDAKINLKNNNIKNMQIEVKQDLEENNQVSIEKKFDTNNNILLNELDNNILNNTLNSLLKRMQADLQNKNNNLSSEVLNYTAKRISEIQNNFGSQQKKEKQRFNNSFLVYKGENISKEVIYNMLDYAGKNMSGYQLFSGGAIKIYLEEGKDNTSQAEELKNRIKDVRENYNVNFQYNSEGKVSVILMQLNIKSRN